MEKACMNNITIINKNQKRKTFTTDFMHYKKKIYIYILNKIFTDQHNSNIKKLNKVNNI